MQASPDIVIMAITSQLRPVPTFGEVWMPSGDQQIFSSPPQ
jgi:hypothetical protein